jgi:hypothetical protein
MRYGKKMVAGGAALLISAGVAHAGQEPSTAVEAERAMEAGRQETSWSANGGASLDPARTKTGAAVTGDGSGYVTHDELDKFSKELIERVDRARNAPTPPPTFTDAG